LASGRDQRFGVATDHTAGTHPPHERRREVEEHRFDQPGLAGPIGAARKPK
jgi:hypothetical protein